MKSRIAGMLVMALVVMIAVFCIHVYDFEAVRQAVLTADA